MEETRPQMEKRLTILEVHTKIKEVDASWADLVDVGDQLFVAHLVWDVLNHDGGPGVLAAFNSSNGQLIFRGDVCDRWRRVGSGRITLNREAPK